MNLNTVESEPIAGETLVMSQHATIDQVAGTSVVEWIVANWLSVAIGAGAVFLGFLDSADAGLISGFIWAIGTAIVGVGVYAMKNLGPLWIEYMRQRSEIKSQDVGSEVARLKRRIADMDKALDAANRKLDVVNAKQSRQRTRD